MNDPTPLPDDLRDELLSAELDDEFDAAAIDLGLEPADARARLAATPGAKARRDAMRDARAQLQTPPEMDELLAARLRSKALNEARAVHDGRKQHRARRLYAVSGAVAAALVAVVGIAFALNGRSEPRDAKASLSAPPSGSSVPVRAVAGNDAAGSHASASHAVFDYGTATDVEALANSVRLQLTNRRTVEAATGTAVAGKLAPDSLDQQANAVDKTAADAPVAHCGPAATQLVGSGTLAFSGTASVAGQPVVVYAFDRPKDDVIVILAGDCRFLRQVVTPRA